MRAISIALVLATGVVHPAVANIIQVPSAHATIQAGINAAAPGDTVQVAPGTYTGPSNRNLDFAGKNILLRSSAGAAITIIDCQAQARGIRFHTGETPAAIVQGFTIRNGLASGTFGGGILVEGGANPNIRNCRLQSNHANTGGGVFVTSGVTLTDCDFQTNSADNYGGAAYAETADIEATRCTFTQNTAGIGAAVALNFGATGALTDCTFTENDPANLGGGLYSLDSAVDLRRCSFVRNLGKNGAGGYLLRGSASVDSCTFTMNTADYGGGGMRAKNVDPLSVTGCRFEGNTTLTTDVGSDTGGGGLFATGEKIDPVISDCTFVGNQTLGSNGATGGGISGGGLLERCQFIDNHADHVGGGANWSGRIHNCTFEGNTAPYGGGLDGGEELIDCRFTDNHALMEGGGCTPVGGHTAEDPCTVLRCEFSGNSAGNRGGGMYFIPFHSLTIQDSQFSDNYATNGGGVFAYLVRPSAIAGCTFVGNTAALGGAVSLSGPANFPSVTLSGSTIVGNGAQIGGGINLTIPVEIANTIIAFGSEGEAIACLGNGLGVMSCTDIYGNAGGNWTSCIADQLGINGNFSLDPRFCSVGGRDFTLAQTSSCTAANAPAGCGLIGAHPVGCATPIGIADAGAPAVTPMLRVTPNPMRRAGMIEWSGVGGRETELRLYDVAGRIVARRVERSAGGGLPWSALVGARDVPSGVYFLEVGEGRAADARVRLVVVR